MPPPKAYIVTLCLLISKTALATPVTYAPSDSSSFDIESISSYLDDDTHGAGSNLGESSKRAIHPDSSLTNPLGYYKGFSDIGMTEEGLYSQSYSSGPYLGSGSSGYSVTDTASLYGQEQNKGAGAALGYNEEASFNGGLGSYNSHNISPPSFKPELGGFNAQVNFPSATRGAAFGGIGGSGQNGYAGTGMSYTVLNGHSGSNGGASALINDHNRNNGGVSALSSYSGGLSLLGSQALAGYNGQLSGVQPYFGTQGINGGLGSGAEIGSKGSAYIGINHVDSPAGYSATYSGTGSELRVDGYRGSNAGGLHTLYKPSSYPSKIQTSYITNYKGSNNPTTVSSGSLSRLPSRNNAYSGVQGTNPYTGSHRYYYNGSPYIGSHSYNGPSPSTSSHSYSTSPYGSSNGYYSSSPYSGRYVRGYKSPSYSSNIKSTGKPAPYSKYY